MSSHQQEPPFLIIGTEVSAKYKGAFCEAKIKKIARLLKCKVTLKDPPQSSLVVTDDAIKGTIKVGAVVDMKHPDTGENVECTIVNVKDCSKYTCVFDDADEATLRRTQMCLKGEKHFVESETLDQLPLTHPEHFGTPVVGTTQKNVKRPNKKYDDSDSDSSLEEDSPVKKPSLRTPDNWVGRILLVETGDKKKSVIHPTLVIVNKDPLKKDQIHVKSFKDSKCSTVLKKDTKPFTRDFAVKNDDKTLKACFEKALLFHDNRELPEKWDKDKLIGPDSDSEDDSGSSDDDEPTEEKDRFVAQLFKFMDDRATPINKAPQLGNKDLNLHKLFKVVQNYGGYNRVTNQLKWRLVYSRMGLPPSTKASDQIKQAYKKYLHAFEDFYRKLGSTMGTISRPSRSRHSNRSILSFREKEMSRSPKNVERLKGKDRGRDDSSNKSKNDSDSDNDSGTLKLEPRLRRSSSRLPVTDQEEESPRKGRSKPDDKKTPLEKRLEEKKATKKADSDVHAVPVKTETESPRRGARARVNDKKKEGNGREEEEDKDTPAKRRRKGPNGDGEKKEEIKKEKIEAESEEDNASGTLEVEYPEGAKVKVKYGKGKTHKVYEAKIVEVAERNGSMCYLVHYAGWNIRYDEWVKKDRIVSFANSAEAAAYAKKKAEAAVKTANQTSSNKKRGRPYSTTPGSNNKISAATETVTRSRSPATAPSSAANTPQQTRPRPTRANSIDLSLSGGLLAKRRPRRGSGYTESESQKSESEADVEIENEDTKQAQDEPIANIEKIANEADSSKTAVKEEPINVDITSEPQDEPPISIKQEVAAVTTIHDLKDMPQVEIKIEALKTKDKKEESKKLKKKLEAPADLLIHEDEEKKEVKGKKRKADNEGKIKEKKKRVEVKSESVEGDKLQDVAMERMIDESIEDTIKMAAMVAEEEELKAGKEASTKKENKPKKNSVEAEKKKLDWTMMDVERKTNKKKRKKRGEEGYESPSHLGLGTSKQSKSEERSEDSNKIVAHAPSRIEEFLSRTVDQVAHNEVLREKRSRSHSPVPWSSGASNSRAVKSDDKLQSPSSTNKVAIPSTSRVDVEHEPANNNTSANHRSSMFLDNTPPETPEGSPVAEHAQNEVNRLNTEFPESPGDKDIDGNQDTTLPFGGESPTAASTVSNGSRGGSSGNAASPGSSSLDREVAGTMSGKVLEETEVKPKGKRRRRKSTKKQHSKHDSDSEHIDSAMASPRHDKFRIPHSPRPSKYDFRSCLEEASQLESEKRIPYLLEKIQEIRKIYTSLKSEVAAIDRRRKRARRKEKEAKEGDSQPTTHTSGGDVECS